VLFVAVAGQVAAQPSPAQQAQQQRMKDCNAKASDQKLSGDARKRFMPTYLKG
jgi:psiF repeat